MAHQLKTMAATVRRITYLKSPKTICQVQDLLDEIGRLCASPAEVIFMRGESEVREDTLPQPSIGKIHNYVGCAHRFDEADERQLIDRFRRRAFEAFNRVPTLWETVV